MNFLFTIALSLLSIYSFSQKVLTATIGTANGVPGDTVHIPINVTQFDSIGSIGFIINFDHTKIKFETIRNITPQIGSNIIFNDNGVVLGIAWTGMQMINIGDGKLFDIKFTILGGSSSICFDPSQSDVYNFWTAEPFQINLNCGQINDISAGISKNSVNTKSNIFPNPSDGNFLLNLFNGDKQIKLFNTNGKIFFMQNINPNISNQNYYINISNLPAGVYVLRIEGEKTRYDKVIIF